MEHGFGRWAASVPPGADALFRDLVPARIMEQTSKMDIRRVWDEVCVASASGPTINRRLPVYAGQDRRESLAPRTPV